MWANVTPVVQNGVRVSVCGQRWIDVGTLLATARSRIVVCGLLVLMLAHCGVATKGPRRPLPLPSSKPTNDLLSGPAVGTDIPPDVLGTLHVQTGNGTWRTIHWEKTSRSIGKPNDGSLVDGRAIPLEGPGWIHVGGNPFGTDETVLLVAWGVAEVGLRYPGTVPVVIGDLSAEFGGPLSPHNSHQSGRDADIGYFAAGNRPLRRFQGMNAESLDAEKTWYLLERLLLTGQIQYLFIHYDLQKLLYDAAHDSGWHPQDLTSIFQYPNGKSSRTGIVRHSPGHADHFHVRFRCPAGDDECVP
ncbi:MAG: penicillin-insensitive murein endopeptidase [Myxococcales bacterium]|nr:penicillin-insensitive murein endopeptidase [Myxococcales bacterium]